MTETNNLSFEKSKDKNFKKLELKKVYHHKKQKTMSEMGFNEIVRVQIPNEEFNNTINNKSNNINLKTKKMMEIKKIKILLIIQIIIKIMLKRILKF